MNPKTPEWKTSYFENTVRYFFQIGTFLFVSFLLSSCIGDALVKVNYEVKNNSNDTLVVHGKSFDLKNSYLDQDSTYILPPQSNQVIQVSEKVCWFGDCREHLRADTLLDTLKVFKGLNTSDHISIDQTDWSIKRKKVILRVN
ncbi:MAG: hypothetical protein AAF193_06470 [Bacteroidota bacterium]